MPAASPGAEPGADLPCALEAGRADGPDPHADLAMLRERGLHRVDPLHFHFLETLDRRSAQQPQAVRDLLQHRLATLVRDSAPADAPTRPPAAPLPGPLGELVRGLPAPAAARAFPAAAGAATRSPTEADVLGYFRLTWSRLNLERQLRRSLAEGPKNAGPLNSHRLVLQALQALRDVSPDYLGRFMAYVDALLWLEQAGSGAAPQPPNAEPGAATHRTAGGRRWQKSQGGGRAAS
jgi:hypothetical protein